MNQVPKEKPILKKWKKTSYQQKEQPKNQQQSRRNIPKENNKSKEKNLQKKTQLANTSPTEYSEKEMKKQVGCVMLNLRQKAWKKC